MSSVNKFKSFVGLATAGILSVTALSGCVVSDDPAINTLATVATVGTVASLFYSLDDGYYYDNRYNRMPRNYRPAYNAHIQRIDSMNDYRRRYPAGYHRVGNDRYYNSMQQNRIERQRYENAQMREQLERQRRDNQRMQEQLNRQREYMRASDRRTNLHMRDMMQTNRLQQQQPRYTIQQRTPQARYHQRTRAPWERD